MHEEIFPKRLTQLRQKKGTSAREMSLSLGQNVNYINSIENKKMFPSMSGFFYICEYFRITPKEFFDDETENPKMLGDILNELKRLSEDQLASILLLLKDLK